MIRSILMAALYCAATGPSAAQVVDTTSPKVEMLLQYARILGEIKACGPLDHTDRLPEMVDALTNENASGFWHWMTGSQADYRDRLTAMADHETRMADIEGCTIAPLQGHYRSLLRSIEGTLLK